MKQLPAVLNTVFLAILAFSLPNGSAQAVQEALTAVGASPTAQATAAPQAGCDPGRSVQVSGSAVVNVIPDRAAIQLGVQSNGTTPQAVQIANAMAIQKVIKAVETLGVQAKDIATDRYIIEPIYEDYNSLRIKGYRIHNIVAITLHDVDKTSSLIATAFSAGANQVVDVQFYTSELRKYRDQARELAMKAAAEKARALAQAVGAKAGCALSINENTSSYYPNPWWYGNNNVPTQNTVQNAAPPTGSGAGNGTESEPLSPGQISIKAEVNVSFGLK